jgi:hypothetical protein
VTSVNGLLARKNVVGGYNLEPEFVTTLLLNMGERTVSGTQPKQRVAMKINVQVDMKAIRSAPFENCL